MRFRTILFDLDGTLVDHFAAIGRSHTHTMRQLGLPVASPARIRAAVGGGLENALAQLVGPARVAEALPIYRAYWDATMLDDVVLLPGAQSNCLPPSMPSASAPPCSPTSSAPPRASSATTLASRPCSTPWWAPRTPRGSSPTPRSPARFWRSSVRRPRPRSSSATRPTTWRPRHQAGLPAWCVTTGTHTADQLRPAGADRVLCRAGGNHRHAHLLTSCFVRWLVRLIFQGCSGHKASVGFHTPSRPFAPRDNMIHLQCDSHGGGWTAATTSTSKTISLENLPALAKRGITSRRAAAWNGLRRFFVW
jgi:hypothetical protein